jgi:hypothetical protein
MSGRDGNEPEKKPGDGIRSLKTSNIFRNVNFELYARPVSWIHGIIFLMIQKGSNSPYIF